MNGATADTEPVPPGPSLVTVAREWGRIGCVGFGGPPTHIRLLRELCVERRGWIGPGEFEDGIAVCNMLPGPASTQLAIYCAWRIRGRVGALVGGVLFIAPGLALILVLAALFLAGTSPRWLLGAAAGAGAAVAAVAVQAGARLVPTSWRRHPHPVRWVLYVCAGAASAATLGPWLVVVLLGCGAVELAAQRVVYTREERRGAAPVPLLVATAVSGGTLLSVAWVAFKVGALAFGGGFVIIPLMQSDAVKHYHWMSASQFLTAVALGQVTPGPVVQTVAVVGYAAAGLTGGLLAAVVVFAPSFAFVLLGANRFDRIRADRRARALLDGAGPAAIGAILGSAIPLARALTQPWQFAVLVGSGLMLVPLRRGVVTTLLLAGATGVLVAAAGGPVPH